jgi:uncharacterized membrane protein (UPF0127 family)
MEPDRVIAAQLEIADTLWKQTVGLLGRHSLPTEGGLWLKPCNGIHTFGMRFPIDVLVLDAEGYALRIVSALKPWRICGPIRKARVVVELPAGTLTRYRIQPGDRFHLSQSDNGKTSNPG